MTLTLLLLITLALAAANGANDNIKGAATLIGSGLADYRRAIVLATAATALGGLLSLLLAHGLLQAFSGQGIVPDAIAGSPALLVAVGAGAGATVWLATRLGLPVSTTHGLVGGLVGAGLAAAPQEVGYAVVIQSMLGPLLASPLAAILLVLLLVPLLRRLGSKGNGGDAEAACVCSESALPAADGSATAYARMRVGRRGDAACRPPATEVASVAAAPLLDGAHFTSAMAVSFARGVNDTPKIAALLVAGGGLGAGTATTAVTVAMAAGGLLAARRVADTLAWRVTPMRPAEGLGGNLVTAVLVLFASRLGLPVSTTHVSTGALFGIGASNRGGRRKAILTILAAWVLTLPLAAGLAAAVYTALAAAWVPFP